MLKPTLCALVISGLALSGRAADASTLSSPVRTRSGPVDAVTVTDPTLLPRVMEEARQFRVANSQPTTNAVADSRSARLFVFPSAGSTPGGGGTLYFRSDVTLANYRSTAQSVLVGFWPVGTSNTLSSTAPNTKIISLPAGEIGRYPDFVKTVMGTEGLGALVFLPVSGTSFDPNAAIDGFSRIYTKQPGSEGTVSQTFEAVDIDSLSVQIEAVSMGLQQDSAFRTNWGIINTDPVSHQFTVSFVGEKQETNTTVTVPAYGMIQQAAPDGDYGSMLVAFTLTDPGSSHLAWTAWASSTDNITGDGWVAHASADYGPNGLASLGF